MGCGGGGSSSKSDSERDTVFTIKPYKTQVTINSTELQDLLAIKYASNKGAGFSTPENFKK